ncbi:succinylglutamate desuccinylase/aspartoacylase family protein [Marivirga sp. S37H4]|uniref:Succinylglutamate desuccinylase/aspartoacylase family protein n=1 Tax=Marivirga aurantiaca TaxID=2802615 RepID=A0A935C5Z5_9BACT|nr:succinylglutamate desuccinylase/aspartoacylase family protein [Marivirga aurantiaca]MBK6264085.1 succinylglutamate desuccinylase/aspartoacylase family protein [Marivirga aurantiaca]
MQHLIHSASLKPTEFKRLIGEYPLVHTSPGPALLVSAGVHGNEPSGIAALIRVFNQLEMNNIQMKGRIMGVSGNLQALKKGVRLIDQDLNRICTPERAEKLEKGHPPDFAEEAEFRELLQIINSLKRDPIYDPLFFMDLHTTSSQTTPYISVNKQEKSFSFAKTFPLPVARGIEQFIPGHFDHYLSLMGHVGFTLEAGQHTDEKSIDHHVAVIWLALAKAGLLLNPDNEFVEHSRQLLEQSSHVKKGNYEVFYRYNIAPGEIFKMEPGFKNFQPIKTGELLATSDNKPIYSEWDAYIFLPLYQQQGSDGFFVVKSLDS